MNSTLIHDLSDYLHAEADRVVVVDSLDDVHAGVTASNTVIQRNRVVPQRRRMAWMGAAASVLLLVGMLAIVGRSRGPAVTFPALASGGVPSLAPDIPSSAPATPPPALSAPATPATTTPAPTAVTTLPTVPLPDGAVFQGVVPSCTTVDQIVYDCTIPEYPPEYFYGDMTGYVGHIVDEHNRVSGGCRVTSDDATHMTCYIGQRAVDEHIIADTFLGMWAPRTAAAG